MLKSCSQVHHRQTALEVKRMECRTASRPLAALRWSMASAWHCQRPKAAPDPTQLNRLHRMAMSEA